MSAHELLKVIQKTAQSANEAGVPCNVIYGKVTSTSPLAIKVREGFVLPASTLVLTRNVSNHTMNVEVNWTTEVAETHAHPISGTKTITVKNALAVGDSVAMIKLQGGQSYLVLDRVVNQ